MSLELVINSTSKGVEIAVLENKQLIELHHEHGKKQFAVGDLYLGKVKKVLPQLNAAFVDVGYEKDAFLHYLDLGAQFSSLKLYTKRVQTGKQNEASLINFKSLPDIDKGGKIKEQVAINQQVVVQVAKEPISAKGPRLTSEITLPGRFLVLVPFSNKISLSQRITNEEERDRLRRLMQSIKPPGCGVIVRTVAENKKVAELDTDLRDLVDRWEKMYDNLLQAKPPSRILGEIDKTTAVLRDLLTPHFKTIYVNDEGVLADVKTYIGTIAPEKEGIVKYVKEDDLFESFSIYRQIKATFGKQVNLKSGAYLIVEHTEAMHVIDVNSGNRKGGVKNQEENALKTNLECAHEIARLLKLRDMGGIICVDFIDMHERANQRKLHETMKECMQDDKAKHNILAPSRFGVVEITRQRVRPETDITTAEKCPSCGGTGKVEAPLLITDELENNLTYLIKEHKLTEIRVLVHPIIDAYIKKGFFNNTLKSWRKKLGAKIIVDENSSLEFLEFHFYDTKGQELTV